VPLILPFVPSITMDESSGSLSDFYDAQVVTKSLTFNPFQKTKGRFRWNFYQHRKTRKTKNSGTFFRCGISVLVLSIIGFGSITWALIWCLYFKNHDISSLSMNNILLNAINSIGILSFFLIILHDLYLQTNLQKIYSDIKSVISAANAQRNKKSFPVNCLLTSNI